MGSSALGKPIYFVIASDPTVTSPGEAAASGKLVVYLQANIHGGEVEGKEAVLALLRELAGARRELAADPRDPRGAGLQPRRQRRPRPAGGEPLRAERPRPDRTARRREEPRPEPRLLQGRSTRNPRVARPGVHHVGPSADGGPPHHRRDPARLSTHLR